jgi:hypothetical protein
MAQSRPALSLPPPQNAVSPPTLTVVSVDSARPAALHEKLRAIREGLDFCGQAPRGWDDTVRSEDSEECGRVYKAMVEVHKLIGDNAYESDVSLTPTGTQYAMRVFGMQKPFTLEDLASIKSLGPRVLQVSYDPGAQGMDQQMRGALVVLVSSLRHESERTLAQQSMPPMPVPETAAATNGHAVVPVMPVPEEGERENKKRKSDGWSVTFRLPFTFGN